MSESACINIWFVIHIILLLFNVYVSTYVRACVRVCSSILCVTPLYILYFDTPLLTNKLLLTTNTTTTTSFPFYYYHFITTAATKISFSFMFNNRSTITLPFYFIHHILVHHQVPLVLNLLRIALSYQREIKHIPPNPHP